MAEARAARIIVREKQTGRSALMHGAELVASYQRALPRRGTSELLRAYGESPVLQSVIRKIASSMAAIEWVAKVASPDGSFVEVPSHISINMLTGGVPGLDGVQCRMLEQTAIELVGEAYSLLDRNRFGVPERRWPIPAHWVANVPTPVEDEFEVRPLGATPFRVRRDDMIWHKDAAPYDPYQRGIGIARSLADELNADEAAAKHAGASLVNRARPDIIISGSKELPLRQEDAVRLSEVWGQRFGGPENAGRPFFSASPITVETLTPSFKELELSKLREFERDIIVTVFGVPPELMGIIENANRATIESAEFLFAKHVLRPRLAQRRAVYNEQVAWQYDERLYIDFIDPVAEDKAFKREVIAVRPQAFTDDEVRDLAGMDPLPDGEGDTRPSPNGGQAEDPGAGVPRSTRARVAKIIDADIDEILAALDRALMSEVLRVNVKAAIAEAGADALEDIAIAIDFDIRSEATEEFIGRTAGERSNLINGTTEKELRKTLKEGVANNEAGATLIERVLAVVTDATVARADMIARTETTRAVGFAATEAFAQAGITEKEWLAVRGSPLPPARGATRDTHREGGLDGQKKPLRERFQSPSGATALYPGDFGVPAEDINCRCVVINADSLGLDEERKTEFYERKAAQMDRLEAGFSRQLRSVFRQQGQSVVEAIERKGNQ